MHKIQDITHIVGQQKLTQRCKATTLQYTFSKKWPTKDRLRGGWAKTGALEGGGGDGGDRPGGPRELGGDSREDGDQKAREGTESRGERTI